MNKSNTAVHTWETWTRKTGSSSNHDGCYAMVMLTLHNLHPSPLKSLTIGWIKDEGNKMYAKSISRPFTLRQNAWYRNLGTTPCQLMHGFYRERRLNSVGDKMRPRRTSVIRCSPVAHPFLWLQDQTLFPPLWPLRFAPCTMRLSSLLSLKSTPISCSTSRN